MPTIIQVAEQAGVSTATVSRVLTKPDRVSAKTRRHVLAVVEALGYKPNLAARTLRTQRADRILLTVPDISNPFFASVIRGAEEAARDAGYAVVVGDTRHDPDVEEQYAEMLSRREVDGLIFLGHRLPDSLRALLDREGPATPIVNGCEYSPELGVPSVHIDNAAAGQDAIEHLIALDHRDIGIITGPPLSPLTRDRLEGAMRAATAHGIADRLRIRTGDYTTKSAFEHTTELLRDHVTAIFCFSDEMAIGAISAIYHAGLSCPDDVSVIGFDDLPMAAYYHPPLTTISQPKGQIGQQAVALLVGILNGPRDEVSQITLPHILAVRHSTARRKG